MRFRLVAGATRLRMPLSLSESGVPLARMAVGMANVRARSASYAYSVRSEWRAAGTHDALHRSRLHRPTHGSVVVSEAHGAGNKWELQALACSSALTGISAASRLLSARMARVATSGGEVFVPEARHCQ